MGGIVRRIDINDNAFGFAFPLSPFPLIADDPLAHLTTNLEEGQVIRTILKSSERGLTGQRII